MASTKPQIITVTGYRRLNSSAAGNPRFVLFTEDGEYITMSDASCSYVIENGWTVFAPVYVVKAEREARVTLTRAGRVRELTWLDGAN